MKAIITVLGEHAISCSSSSSNTFSNEGTGAGVGQMSVGSTAKPKPSPLLIQFEGKNFSRKIVPDTSLVRDEIVTVTASFGRGRRVS